jgi:small nuclear ribonucleoprotein (snRNP)-like protein
MDELGDGVRRHGAPAGRPDATGSWTDEVDRVVAEERVRAAAGARRRERWQRDRSAGDVSVTSALRSATGSTVEAHLADGRLVRGRLLGVGVDVAAIQVATGQSWVALWAVEAVSLEGCAGSEPDPGAGPTMAEIMADLRDDASMVTLSLRGGAVVRGTLKSVGASVTIASDDGTTTVVAPESIVSASH